MTRTKAPYHGKPCPTCGGTLRRDGHCIHRNQTDHPDGQRHSKRQMERYDTNFRWRIESNMKKAAARRATTRAQRDTQEGDPQIAESVRQALQQSPFRPSVA